MNTIQEQRTIIERLVRLNNKYIGNEDLFEDFCSEAYKRSYTLFDNNEIKNFESYLAKVVNTSILNVLRTSGRIRRHSNRYVSTHEVLMDPTPAPQQFVHETVPQVQMITPVAEAQPVFLYNVPDPKNNFEERIVRKDLLQKVVDIVLVAHKNNPNREYLRIFFLRYVKEKKQREIAEITQLSQSEVSKRLLEIAEIVKSHFNK